MIVFGRLLQHLLTVRLQEEEDFANMKTNEVKQELKKRGLTTVRTEPSLSSSSPPRETIETGAATFDF